MTNIKYLKNNNLLEAHEHFMRLSESYVPSFPEENVDEADDMQDQMGYQGEEQDTQQPQQMGDGGMPQDQDLGNGGMDGGMGDNQMDGSESDGIGEPQDQGMMGGEMTDDQVPQLDPTEQPIDGENDSDDGNTIDIDGLTKVQDKLNVKQNHLGRDFSKVDTKIEDLIDTIKSLQSRLDANNSEIESLKSEFEKRNPTQTEKLNLRSLDSYPFNVKPNDYWRDQEKKGGYEAYSDNSEPTTKEYVITNDDVDNPSKNIADTFFKIDDDDIQTLDKLFKL